MKLGIAQFNPKIGDFNGNGERARLVVLEARKAGVSLLVFPELSLCGYPPRDFLDYSAFVKANLDAMEKLAGVGGEMTLVCGFVEPNPAATGKPLFNAAAVYRNGRRLATYHKQLLPYYDVFDEERYFEPGREGCVFEVEGKKIALTICEDAWNLPGYLKRPYAHQPLDFVKNSRPDLMLNLSASPFDLGKPQRRIELFKKVAAYVGATVVVSGQTGGNDELLFDGGSLVVSPQGEVLARAPVFTEVLMVYEIGAKASALTPWPDSEEAWLSQALEMGIRDYAKKSGIGKVCLGLSGGIDSSVVAVLAARALGKEAVSAVALPSRYNSGESLEDAEVLAKRLGIEFSVFSIQPVFSLLAASFKEWLGRAPASLTLENIQPRLRMTALMAKANEEGRLLLNTSNKTEIATGFATLYGDSAGALAVLGDLTKAQVYALARYFNASVELIPTRVISRAPSAELRENQTDQDTLPPYSVLDALVEENIVGLHSPLQLRAKHPSEIAHIDRFARMHAQSEYKRHQLPPALRVSARGYGMGRRLPVTAVKPE